MHLLSTSVCVLSYYDYYSSLLCIPVLRAVAAVGYVHHLYIGTFGSIQACSPGFVLPYKVSDIMLCRGLVAPRFKYSKIKEKAERRRVFEARSLRACAKGRFTAITAKKACCSPIISPHAHCTQQSQGGRHAFHPRTKVVVGGTPETLRMPACHQPANAPLILYGCSTRTLYVTKFRMQLS